MKVELKQNERVDDLHRKETVIRLSRIQKNSVLELMRFYFQDSFK